jgi:hypothetical protein
MRKKREEMLENLHKGFVVTFSFLKTLLTVFGICCFFCKIVPGTKSLSAEQTRIQISDFASLMHFLRSIFVLCHHLLAISVWMHIRLVSWHVFNYISRFLSGRINDNRYRYLDRGS